MRASSSILLLLGLIALASARTITWTGTAGNSLWSFAANWDGNTVPTSADDVVLNFLGGATVTISQPSFALSITLGGGDYPQSLTVQSSVTVGAGGVKINNKGTLQLQGNNDLPFSSAGPVVTASGGAINFASGEITGKGPYTVLSGGSIVFSSTALKLIQGTTLQMNGVATIQPTTIQLSKGASVQNTGGLTAIGGVTIFSNDMSGATFTNSGNFTYQGSSADAPLVLQVSTTLTTDFTITSGAVRANDYFMSTGTVNVPVGTSFTVGSGTTTHTIASVTGAGLFVVQGAVEVKRVLDVGSAVVSDSGSLNLTGSGMRVRISTLSSSGKISLASNVNLMVGDAKIIAGTVTSNGGNGSMSVSGSFDISPSAVGNANSFISAQINIAGAATLTGSVYLLFADAGNLNIASGASLKISSTTHFAKQSGNPVVTNNGQISITLTAGNYFDSGVDIIGSGSFMINSGRANIDAIKFQTGSITVGTSALLVFDTTIISSGSVSGGGSLNVTAAPTPVSVFGDITLAYFGVPNGAVQVRTLAVSTFELWGGSVAIAPASTNKATIFNFYGGLLQGASAMIRSSQLSVGGPNPQIIDGVTIQANTFTLRTVGNNGGSLQTKNGAQILVTGN